MNSGIKRIVWLLNTTGLVIYLFWLYSMSDREILRAQGGILYFIPIIPFFFVYLLLIPPKKPQIPREAEPVNPQSAESDALPPSR